MAFTSFIADFAIARYRSFWESVSDWPLHPIPSSTEKSEESSLSEEEESDDEEEEEDDDDDEFEELEDESSESVLAEVVEILRFLKERCFFSFSRTGFNSS